MPIELDGEKCSTRSVIEAQKKWEVPVKTDVLILYWAGHVPHFEAIWSSTWAEVAPERVNLGPSWAKVGALLAEVDPKWSRIETVHLADVGLQNLQNPTAGKPLLAA